jgi:hypothetical protein
MFGISVRSIASFFGLLALAIQALIVQTHVHMPAVYAHQIAPTYAHADATSNEYPTPKDPAVCPLCQEMLLVGSFVPAAAIPLPAPVAIDSEVALSREMISGSTASHSWHGRAPPLA